MLEIKLINLLLSIWAPSRWRKFQNPPPNDHSLNLYYITRRYETTRKGPWSRTNNREVLRTNSGGFPMNNTTVQPAKTLQSKHSWFPWAAFLLSVFFCLKDGVVGSATFSCNIEDFGRKCFTFHGILISHCGIVSNVLQNDFSPMRDEW